mgnify:CR=1 FL=1
MKMKLIYTLTIDVEVDGHFPGNNEVSSAMVDGLNQSMPSLIGDDEGNYAILVDAWSYDLDMREMVINNE